MGRDMMDVNDVMEAGRWLWSVRCCYKHYLQDFLFNPFPRLAHPSPNSLVSLITECKSPPFSPLPHSHQAHFNSRHIFQHPSRCQHIHTDFWFNAIKLRCQIFKGKTCMKYCKTAWRCFEMCHLLQVGEHFSSHLNQAQRDELERQN